MGEFDHDDEVADELVLKGLQHPPVIDTRHAHPKSQFQQLCVHRP